VSAFAEHYITSKEAAALLGCSELTVQSWARAGTIPAASGPGIDGCHSYRFEKARLVQWREEHMSYQEASQWLGRSKATLHRWIQQGQLTPLPDSRGKSHWFACSAVTQLAPVKTAQLSRGPEWWYLSHRGGLALRIENSQGTHGTLRTCCFGAISGKNYNYVDFHDYCAEMADFGSLYRAYRASYVTLAAPNRTYVHAYRAKLDQTG
jgi:excisionase family DNA binding protein